MILIRRLNSVFRRAQARNTPIRNTPARNTQRRRVAMVAPLLLAAGMIAGCGESASPPESGSAPRGSDAPLGSRAESGPEESAGENSRAVGALVAARRQLDETVWSGEKEAQKYEAAIVRFWDRLLAARGESEQAKFDVFRSLPIEHVRLGNAVRSETIDHGIERTELGGDGRELDREAWSDVLDAWFADGFRLVQSEWHHAAFERDADGGPRSTVSMVLHLLNTERDERLIVRGQVLVTWAAERDAEDRPIPRAVDARDLEVLTRRGPAGFREILTYTAEATDQRRGVHPLLVHDLDGDGRSEIVLAGVNRVFWNRGEGQFEERAFLATPPRFSKAGLLADLDNDGRLDYATVDAQVGLVLYSGDGSGQFRLPPRPLAPIRFENPQVMTAGDIDGDGDLDLWVGQHKAAYLFGQMPTPYYDANDGFPAFLLLNEGEARFRDVTEQAGLAPLRHRRTYGASFVHLNRDDALDLLVVSDFAGIDAYLNDGSGRFREVTDEFVDQRHNFGMSASFADFDLDGAGDFYVTGMASTTARRLERLGLRRGDMPDVHRMRPIMGYGSRMFVARGDRYVQPDFADQVNRTGWTWGSTAVDFDNDGDRDIYLANGHSSGKSTKDHCWHFWCHDIYTNSSELDPVRDQLFRSVLSGFEDGSESWDGYQKNALLMNQRGKGFERVGFLFGLAHEYDARAVVGDDLDGDGRMDLLVVEHSRLRGNESLHVYRNELDLSARWIGVEVVGGKPGDSPLGARIRVVTASGVQPGQILTGDSYSAQHAARLHFGLGGQTEVQRIEVRWPDGKMRRLTKPAVNQYHRVRRP